MEEFSTLDELKIRIMPAIDTKISEIKANYYKDVSREDIWEFLKIKWGKSLDLTLYDMVGDILNLDNDSICEFSDRRMLDDKG